MTLVKKEGRPGFADSVEVNSFSINVYPGSANGGAKSCLVIPPFVEDNEFRDMPFNEQELRELAEAATWAADKLKART